MENQNEVAAGAARPATMEECCGVLRSKVQGLKADVVALLNHDDFKNEDSHLDGANIPGTQHANMVANITLAFRALEDARMRLGKVMQAYQGGVSIFDKPAHEPGGAAETERHR